MKMGRGHSFFLLWSTHIFLLKNCSLSPSSRFRESSQEEGLAFGLDRFKYFYIEKSGFFGYDCFTVVGGFKGGNEKQSVLLFIWSRRELLLFLCSELRDRLMVGHRPLKASILVRVQVPQLCVQKFSNKAPSEG